LTKLTDEDAALAAEYVLKLLDRADEAQAQARIATDPDFAREVLAWNARFEPLVAQAPAEPPAHIWPLIEARVTPSTQQDGGNGGVRFWQGMSLASVSVAAVLAFILVSQPVTVPPEASPPPQLVAALGQRDEPSTMTISYDPGTGALILTPVSLNTGPLVPELWVIDGQGEAHSLGLITRNHPTKHVVPGALRALIIKGATLAVTPEPSGGAPGGKATGPIIASGKITSV
jgi:anti-sigma-K factor RskA